MSVRSPTQGEHFHSVNDRGVLHTTVTILKRRGANPLKIISTIAKA
jgi:hypothetical protein